MTNLRTKEVIKHKNGKVTIDNKVCHPKKLPSKIKYIAPYWHLAFENVLRYQKERGLQEIHKIVDNSRIEKGFKLYEQNRIKEITVTTEAQGDINALVRSEDGTKEYRVIMKNFLPEKGKLPQYNHERERFISEFLVTCSCDDHIIHRYSSNVSIFCKHICAVIWFLIKKYNMPKIFIDPIELRYGYKKSEVEEIVTNIEALPLVKFTQHLNILLLKNFRGMNPALGLSIHRIDNKTNQEIGKPQWLTYTSSDDVMSLMGGLLIVHNKMNPEHQQKLEPVDIEPTENTRFIHGRWTKKLYDYLAIKNKKRWQFYKKIDYMEEVE